MRKFTGSDIFDTEETVPYEWTCDHSYYGTGDGCVSSGHGITLLSHPLKTSSIFEPRWLFQRFGDDDLFRPRSVRKQMRCVD